MNAIDPDNLIQFRERLNVAGEFLCSRTDDPKAREAYAAVLYVQSSLKLDAEEMRLAAQEQTRDEQKIARLIYEQTSNCTIRDPNSQFSDGSGAIRAARAVLAAIGRTNPWAHIPKQYAGRWGYDYDEKNSTFFVHCGGHRICDAEDSEVCDAICRAHNTQDVWLRV
jgi:hypothetical protein